MASFYLETSFVSACVTTRHGLQMEYQRETALLWWRDEAPQHTLYTSDAVLQELGAPGHQQRAAALRLVAGVTLVPIIEAMEAFAETLIEHQVMPRGLRGDALHVAAATVARIDYLLTWNVKHLANPNKVLHLNAVCQEHGYLPPRIVRPDDFVELEP